MNQFDETLAAFELAWQQGAEPRIEAYLGSAADVELLVELIHLDLDYQLKRDDRARIEDYLKRFGQLERNHPSIADLACAEFRIRDHLLRQPDLDKLLDRFPEHREFLANQLSPSRPLVAPLLPASTEPQRLRTRTGSRHIGPYKLLQMIGEGGMGSVYMAEQEEPIRRRVALKVIKPGMDSRQVILRFEAERQALAMMDHQNIAKVLDAGVTTSGQLYFAMELVNGLPITEYCDKNRLSLPQRLELFVQACRGIQHAHQKGILHRDIKPSNVLVALNDGTPQVKVIDFGLAKALQSETRLSDGTIFTEFGQVLGTIQYMSPEQAEVNTLDIDTRADIYSLGVLLYELLTGSTPIERQRLKDMALDAILRAIQLEDPPRPSVRLTAAGDAVHGISSQRKIDTLRLTQLLRGELDWIVMRALENDRTRRYDSPAAFADDIQRFLNNQVVVARPPSVIYLLSKAYRRHRVAVLMGLAFLALLLLGIITSTSLAILANSEAHRANDLARTETEQRLLAQAAQREADRLTQESESREHVARHNLYAAHLAMANQALQSGSIEEAERLLDKQVPGENESDIRSFPWYYLSKYSDSAEHILTGHSGTPTIVAFSPDGLHLASGSEAGEVLLWAPERGQLIATLKQQGAAITGLAFANRGQVLISASEDRSVVVWNMPQATSERRFVIDPATRAGDALNSGEEVKIFSIGVLDSTFICGLSDGSVCICDWASGEIVSRQQVFNASVEKIAINANTGQIGIIGFSEDAFRHIRSAKIWDLIPQRPEEWEKPRATIDVNTYDDSEWEIWKLEQMLREMGESGVGVVEGGERPPKPSPFYSTAREVATGG